MKKIIGLDEVGRFEDRSSGVRFIGGYVMYAEDYEEEKKRISEQLRAVCEDFNQEMLYSDYDIFTCYPDSLHMSGPVFYHKVIRIPGEQNDETICPVKERDELKKLENEFRKRIIDKVIQIIREKSGRIYAYLDPYVVEEGKEKAKKPGSNVVDENEGANFYERMATLGLFHQVFYDVEEKCDDYYLELATRTLDDTGDGFRELYAVYRNRLNQYKSTITNTSTYKTAVSSMLYGENVAPWYMNASYHFNVKSINYAENDEPTPYLYLADIVCRYVLRSIQTRFYVNAGTKKNMVNPGGLKSFCEQTGIQVKIYDECDDLYRKMVRHVQNRDLELYAATKYEMVSGNHLYGEFYTSFWVPKLERAFSRFMKEPWYRGNVKERFPEYVMHADGFMGKREVSYEQGMFVARELMSIISDMNDYGGQALMQFRLYDVMLRGYNHRGDLEGSKECIARCEKLKSVVAIEEYIAHTLRTMVYYFNSFKYDEVINAGKPLERIVNVLKRVYMDAYQTSSEVNLKLAGNEPGMNSYRFTLAGKLYSSMGQAYAFSGLINEAKRYFKLAMEEFDRDGADYAITASHMLYLFISDENQREYEVHACDYFGARDLWNQMENCIRRVDKDGGFALLVFVKAFRNFYARDGVYENLLSEMVARIDNIKRVNEHPWELIYKHLYFSLKQRPELCERLKGERYLKLSSTTVIHADRTVRMLQAYGKLSEATEEQRSNYLNLLTEEEKDACRYFMPEFERTDFDGIMEWFKRHLTYEYD